MLSRKCRAINAQLSLLIGKRNEIEKRKKSPYQNKIILQDPKFASKHVTVQSRISRIFLGLVVFQRRGNLDEKRGSWLILLIFSHCFDL